jgi:hypothetical protein
MRRTTSSFRRSRILAPLRIGLGRAHNRMEETSWTVHTSRIRVEEGPLTADAETLKLSLEYRPTSKKSSIKDKRELSIPRQLKAKPERLYSQGPNWANDGNQSQKRSNQEVTVCFRRDPILVPLHQTFMISISSTKNHRQLPFRVRDPKGDKLRSSQRTAHKTLIEIKNTYVSANHLV